MENLKTWLIEVGIKKMGPSAVRAALAAFVGLLMAHSGILAKFGVVYDQATNTVMLHLSALQEWADVSGLGLIAAAFMAMQRHASAAIQGTPQSGAPTEGGQTK